MNSRKRCVHPLASDSPEGHRPDRARAVTSKTSGARREIALGGGGDQRSKISANEKGSRAAHRGTITPAGTGTLKA
jgi:hypothetical protein